MTVAVAKLPATVEAGPFTYTVGADELTRLRTEATEGRSLLGHTNHETLAVFVKESLAAGAQRETLFHEVLHIATEVSGLSSTWKPDEEEAIVRRLSPVLLDLLRRNPELVAFVLAEASR